MAFNIGAGALREVTDENKAQSRQLAESDIERHVRERE
jgi:hypothetical protein